MDQSHSENVVKVSEVINTDVFDKQKQKIGKIQELILDKYTGAVRYAVLSFGGFLGMGDKLFALPWSTFHYETSAEGFVLNVDKDKIENAQGFDKDNWPDWSNEEWQSSIFEYYGVKPYWQQGR